MSVGIGITSFNRPEILDRSIEFDKKHLPEGAKLVIVDDGSTERPKTKVDYRFPHNSGIASAKNKCLELLEGCEHIMLFDSDAWPIVADWHIPYINSGIKHLSFTFPKLISGRPNGRNLLNIRNGIS